MEEGDYTVNWYRCEAFEKDEDTKLKMKIYRRPSQILKTDAKKTFYKIAEYFLVCDLEPHIKKDQFSKNVPRLCYRYPPSDRRELPLDSLNEINLFTFPSYFHFRESWIPPIVFHSTVTLNEQRIYGSTLIFYKKILSKTESKMLYEPISLTFLSKTAFLDQFSAILKYLYLSHFHSGFEKTVDLKSPAKNMAKFIRLLCGSIPPPSTFRTISLKLEPSKQESLSKKGSPKNRRKTITVYSKTKIDSNINRVRKGKRRETINHPILVPGEGVSFKETRSSVIEPLEKLGRLKLGEMAPNYLDATKTNLIRMQKPNKKLHRSCSASVVENTIARKMEYSKAAADIFENDVPITLSNSRFLSNESFNVEVSLHKDYRFFSLPLLSVNLYQNLLNIFDVHTIVKVVACLMCEISTVFFSSQFSLLTKIQECFKALLFPFIWSHIYIPNLPRELLHIVDAPVPVYFYDCSTF
ncbi:DENN domain-containing protein 5B [Bonamia ostreae]|uniref:DENN domain-containing protein 5B n=1 Tax=Bonamia ostreae TaxID=126728 RepID=A0ABV2ANB6_9EUKA